MYSLAPSLPGSAAGLCLYLGLKSQIFITGFSLCSPCNANITKPTKSRFCMDDLVAWGTAAWFVWRIGRLIGWLVNS